VVGVVRDIVEQHQARTDWVFEVEHIQARWGLVETVSIPARIKTQ
jgi:hypothetical protein